MPPKLLLPRAIAVLVAPTMPVAAAVAVPLPPHVAAVAVPPPVAAVARGAAPPAAFIDPVPDALVVHVPFPGRRVGLDDAPRGDDDLAKFSFDGTFAVDPEPSTWPLFVVGYGLTGLALIGFVLRRRGSLRRVAG